MEEEQPVLMPVEGEPQSLSKNAQKRLKKKEEREKTKGEWRAKLREKRKASRKRKVQECLKQGVPVPQRRFRQKDENEKVGRVVFDLDYDGMMSEKEIASLCSQINRCYSINRRGEKPFKLMITKIAAVLPATGRMRATGWRLSVPPSPQP